MLRRAAARAALPLAIVGTLLAPAPRAAAADPAQICRQRQLSAASHLYRSSHTCWSRAFSNLAFDPFACLGRAEDAFRRSYASAAKRAESAGSHCGLRMPADSLVTLAASQVEPLVAAIAGNVAFDDPVDRSLRAKLMNAAAAFTGSAFAAELDFARRGDDARRSARLADARTRLARVFAAAVTAALDRGVVYDGLAADSVADEAGTWADLWERITRADLGAFSLSGTVFAAESTFVDSDVNDTNVSPVDNGAFAPQPLPVPSTVGGYVNVAGAGPFGNSHDLGDPLDRYDVALLAGQVVVLALGDPAGTLPGQPNLDLCLSGPLPIPGPPICSEGTGSYEIAVAPQDGEYFIDVRPHAGCFCASTYTLSIGQTVPAQALRADRTDLEFVPGELIVKLREPAQAAGAARPLALPADTGLEKIAGAPPRPMLMRLPAGSARAAAFRALGVAEARDRLAAQALPAAELSRQETLLALHALRARPEFESVDLNYVLHASAVPSDPLYTLQWHYALIHLPQAWDIETGSPSVVVAVVDTGVRLDHPDLQGKLVAGYDFVSDATRARDGDGIDPDPNDPGDRAFGSSSSFHGTHVAGTIAAATNNGIGVAGVAWGSKVMPVRVLGQNGGTLYDVMQGVAYAAGLPNDSGTVPAKPADVINLSLGGGGYSDAAQTLFDQVRAAGVIVAAAAGNDASSAPSFPAAYDGVISVAAVDLNRNPAFYSNFGTTIDVAAPGGDTSVDRNADGWADGVLSTLADDSSSPIKFGYVFDQGTSMATPHVSGVLALMRSVAPTISPATIDALLASGSLTDDLLAPGRDDQTGFGLIDARAAVLAAGAPDTPPATRLSVTPSGLNFGLSLDSLDLVVANASSDPLTISSVAVEDPGSAPWLSLAAGTVDGSGLGTYHVTVSRTGLANGSYAATIGVVSSAGTVHVPVVMRVGGPTASDAGFHYVLLVDAQSFEPIAEVALPAENGAYPYAFTDVPQGQYLVIAGTDLDDDGFICDGGEACGSYPTLDLPAPIALDHDVTGADFGTAFRQSISTGASASAPAVPAPGLRRGVR